MSAEDNAEGKGGDNTGDNAGDKAGAHDVSARQVSTHTFRYDGRVGTLYGVWLLNLVLNVVTIGIYSFWGRTRIRRYVVASFALDGDNLEYTGTGKELFKGFLKALPLILVLYTPILLAQRFPLGNLAFFPLLYFVYVGLYAAMRYRLTRTTWRGIRGRLTGSAFKYGALSLSTLFLTIITLGLIKPWADRVMIRYMMSHVWFGDAQAEFTDNAQGLWRTHFLALIAPAAAAGIFVAIMIMAEALQKEGEGAAPSGIFIALSVLLFPLMVAAILSRLWYTAALRRYQFNNLKIGVMQFAADYTGWSFVRLLIGNGLLIMVTLGFGVPFIINRNAAFLARHISMRGDLQAAAAHFKQSQDDLTKSGEGLDGIIGVDSSFF